MEPIATMGKPTKEQFDEAIKIIRSYAPDVFLNVQPLKTKNQHPHEKLDYLVYHDGYFNICSRITGEILKSNVFVNIKDQAGEPLSATGEFHLTYGEVIDSNTDFQAKSIVISKQEYDFLTKNIQSQEKITIQKKVYLDLKLKAEMYDLDRELKSNVNKKRNLWQRIMNR